MTLVSTKILSIGRVLFQEFVGHERLVIEVRRKRHDAVQFVRKAGGRFRFAIFRLNFRTDLNFYTRLPNEPQQRSSSLKSSAELSWMVTVMAEI